MTEEEQVDASPKEDTKMAAASENETGSPDDSKTSADNAEVTIRLDQFLQGCGVATGGQAKRLIQSGEILVNEQVETRRKKKLFVGDEVTLDDEVYVVAIDDGSDPEAQE